MVISCVESVIHLESFWALNWRILVAPELVRPFLTFYDLLCSLFKSLNALSGDFWALIITLSRAPAAKKQVVLQPVLDAFAALDFHNVFRAQTPPLNDLTASLTLVR